jgi:phage I-like protein
MTRKAGMVSGRLAPEIGCEIGDSVRDDLSVQLADKTREGKPKTWIQVAKSGDYKGHPAGEFSFGPKQYEEMVRNFKAHQSKPPLDFEHASEAVDGGVYQHGAPANGFIIDLRYDADRMDALVEWVEESEGCQYVRSGQYRYISPAVNFAAKDRVNGKKIGAMLTSVALTNRPYLDGMDRVAAKDGATPVALADGADDAADSGMLATDGPFDHAKYKACQACNRLNDVASKACVKCGEEMGDDEGGDEQAGSMSAAKATASAAALAKSRLCAADRRSVTAMRARSFDALIQNVCEEVCEAIGWDAWVVEVFDGFAIFRHKERLFKIGYRIVDGDEVELESTATEVERDYVPMEGGAEMKLLLTALGLNESANEAAAVDAVATIKASAAAAASAQKALLTAKSAMGLPATATDEDVISKVTELTAASSQIVTLRSDLDAAKAEIERRDSIALNARVETVIKYGATYGFGFPDTP